MKTLTLLTTCTVITASALNNTFVNTLKEMYERYQKPIIGTAGVAGSAAIGVLTMDKVIGRRYERKYDETKGGGKPVIPKAEERAKPKEEMRQSTSKEEEEISSDDHAIESSNNEPIPAPVTNSGEEEEPREEDTNRGTDTKLLPDPDSEGPEEPVVRQQSSATTKLFLALKEFLLAKQQDKLDLSGSDVSRVMELSMDQKAEIRRLAKHIRALQHDEITRYSNKETKELLALFPNVSGCGIGPLLPSRAEELIQEDSSVLQRPTPLDAGELFLQLKELFESVLWSNDRSRDPMMLEDIPATDFSAISDLTKNHVSELRNIANRVQIARFRCEGWGINSRSMAIHFYEIFRGCEDFEVETKNQYLLNYSAAIPADRLIEEPPILAPAVTPLDAERLFARLKDLFDNAWCSSSPSRILKDTAATDFSAISDLGDLKLEQLQTFATRANIAGFNCEGLGIDSQNKANDFHKMFRGYDHNFKIITDNQYILNYVAPIPAEALIEAPPIHLEETKPLKIDLCKRCKNIMDPSQEAKDLYSSLRSLLESAFWSGESTVLKELPDTDFSAISDLNVNQITELQKLANTGMITKFHCAGLGIDTQSKARDFYDLFKGCTGFKFVTDNDYLKSGADVPIIESKEESSSQHKETSRSRLCEDCAEEVNPPTPLDAQGLLERMKGLIDSVWWSTGSSRILEDYPTTDFSAISELDESDLLVKELQAYASSANIAGFDCKGWGIDSESKANDFYRIFKDCKDFKVTSHNPYLSNQEAVIPADELTETPPIPVKEINLLKICKRCEKDLEPSKTLFSRFRDSLKSGFNVKSGNQNLPNDPATPADGSREESPNQCTEMVPLPLCTQCEEELSSLTPLDAQGLLRRLKELLESAWSTGSSRILADIPTTDFSAISGLQDFELEQLRSLASNANIAGFVCDGLGIDKRSKAIRFHEIFKDCKNFKLTTDNLLLVSYGDGKSTNRRRVN